MKWRNWFRRSKNDKTIIKEYRQATEAVSRPLAILLTLVVLFVCAALIFSLFVGGRWLYRQIFDNNHTAPVSVQVDINQMPTPTPSADANIVITTSVPTPTPGSVSGSVRWGIEPTPEPTPIPTTTPTPVVGQTDNIPNTGPEPE